MTHKQLVLLNIDYYYLVLGSINYYWLVWVTRRYFVWPFQPFFRYDGW